MSSSELTNLLPNERQNKLIQEYRFRLGVVALFLFSVLIGVAAVLLVPTYIFLVANVNAKQTHLADIKSTLSSADEKALDARLAILSSNATSLTALSKKPSASILARSVLDIPRPGIKILGFTYTAATGKTLGVLALSGTALTREVLRSYQLVLQEKSFARSVELPVSVYAKDTDITFTITITLTP